MSVTGGGRCRWPARAQGSAASGRDRGAGVTVAVGPLAATATALFFMAVVSGCAFESLGNAPVEPRPAMPWLEAPLDYAQQIAAAEPASRERERREAIDYLLRAPRAESAVRLHLVFAAAVQELEEAYAAVDALEAGLAQAGSPFARSALSAALVSTRQHEAHLRAVLAATNELNVERGRREQVELERDRAARERVRLERAVDELQGRVRALMSIEQQLQNDEAG